jgi:hypothetical protein
MKKSKSQVTAVIKVYTNLIPSLSWMKVMVDLTCVEVM